ncbi:hypothetical protein N7501_008638 [Penicillium viridicatum]|nr:hypothetical protein N7501_008638 [Penicillium viridicatum]
MVHQTALSHAALPEIKRSAQTWLICHLRSLLSECRETSSSSATQSSSSSKDNSFSNNKKGHDKKNNDKSGQFKSKDSMMSVSRFAIGLRRLVAHSGDIKANITDEPEAETTVKTVPCWFAPISIIIS